MLNEIVETVYLRQINLMFNKSVLPIICRTDVISSRLSYYC